MYHALYLFLLFLPVHLEPITNHAALNVPKPVSQTPKVTPANGPDRFTFQEGGIIRGDSTKRQVALIFTGDEYFEGLGSITHSLEAADVKGSFFLTGRLYRNRKATKSIRSLHRKGHYMGPHSDMHLLYNDWARRDSLLVSKDSMLNDLMANYASMQRLGIDHPVKYFIPPFEWWNRDIAAWCREKGVILFNFSPGTATNADYTYPEMGAAYRSSDTLMQRLLSFESRKGLGGCMILVHIGTDPRRKDKLYERLPEMIRILRVRGYVFNRVDEMLGEKQDTYQSSGHHVRFGETTMSSR